MTKEYTLLVGAYAEPTTYRPQIEALLDANKNVCVGLMEPEIGAADPFAWSKRRQTIIDGFNDEYKGGKILIMSVPRLSDFKVLD